MATEKNFQATTPAAPANSRNAIWQVSGTSSGNDAITGQPVYPASCYLTDMVGDTGSGGSDGLVPAPPSGSAAAGDFLKADGTWANPATSFTVVGFIISSGIVATNAGPMLAAPSAGKINSCVVVTKASDASIPFQFDIKQNGTSVFTGTLPTVSAGTSSGTVTTFTSLTSVPLTVAKGDVFSINIIQGSSSWLATVQLET